MKIKSLLLVICSSLLLTGCWDERLLKDAYLVYTMGMDKEGDEVAINIYVPPFDQFHTEGSSIYQVGRTIRDARYIANSKSAENIDYSKLQLIMMGEDLAKEDIYFYLDALYRNPHNNLSARLAVVEGKAGDLLHKPLATQKNTTEYFTGLIRSAEFVSLMPKMSLQYACTLLFDPGQDLYLPYLAFDEQTNRGEVSGIALFNDKKFTGTVLSQEQATLFNLINNKLGNVVRLTRKYKEKEEPETGNYMTIETTMGKAKIKIENNATLATTIKIQIKAVVTEYAPLVPDEKAMREVEEWWTKEIKKDAEELVGIMQEAKSDGFGIGRKVAAFHPQHWDEKTWKDKYAELPVIVEVDFKLIGTGLID
ncbi:Ger(x)C family spore germination protein [Jeotgalibacillus proteolyticus]|uniref:Ger(X)C family spore germination protein n=1 Tax=Jeotgalibacillus proteolyticus TaxID=2082395 RepID=A0A2S5GE45_9BACL|nr:Ger(x)C family spore germination protein [Jeotgalibacillus proteolyticus]PPA71185.1 hypothetical protein C4B60_03715 [Jeotgalibacillus proteolyticus]